MGYLDGVTSKIQTQFNNLTTQISNIDDKYVKLVGGNSSTMTGNLYISNTSYGGVRIENTTVNSGTYIQAWDQASAIVSLNVYGDTSNRRILYLRTSDNTANGNLSNSLVIRDDIESSSTYYNIYGEHNMKPENLTLTIFNSNDTFDCNCSKYYPILGFCIIDVSVIVNSRGITPGGWLKICRIKSGYRPISIATLSCHVNEAGTTGIYQAFADTDGYIQIFSKTGTWEAGNKITFSVNGCYIVSGS